MNILLDTHALLWFSAAPEKLSALACDLLLNKDNRLWVSVVNARELQIKTQLGKLHLDTPSATLLDMKQQKNRIALLGLKLPHIYALDTLAAHHRDPFDRLLIAQARAEGYHLMSADQLVRLYRDDIEILW